MKPGPLGFLGSLLLGVGLPLALLVPVSGDPVARCFGPVLLAAGGAVTLLDGVFRRATPVSLLAIVAPLLLALSFLGATHLGITHAFEAQAAALGALGLHALGRERGLLGALRRIVLGVATFSCLLALAQALYQRSEAREVATGALTETDTARAFLESTRAAAMCINPNVFAGFLLLAAPLAFSLRGKGRWVVLLLMIAGFVAARSLGASLALMVASGAVLAHNPATPRHRTIGRALLGASALAILLLGIALTTDVTIPGVSGKLTSLAQRVDYHRHALRLLPEVGVTGIGLERFAERASLVVHAGEASSRYVHDGYLQLLLELGPLAFLSLLALLLFVLARAVTHPAPTQDVPTERLMERLFLGGGILGLATTPLLAPMATLFSLNSPLADTTLINGLVAALIGFLVLRIPQGALAPRMLALALLAFLLHNLVDFDVYSPNVVTLFAVTLALLPQAIPPLPLASRSLIRLRQGLTMVLALVGLAMPLLIGSHALEMQIIERFLNEGEQSLREGRALLDLGLASNEDGGVVAMKLRLALAANDLDLAESTLRETAPKVRELPAVRRLEAAVIGERFRAEPAFRAEALPRLRALLREGEEIEAELLFRQHRIERAGGVGDPKETARRALLAAKAWGLSPADHPFLKDLERY